MAALVQTLPAQSTTTAVMSRPGSADRYSTGHSHHHHQSSRSSQKHASVNYRGMPSNGPVAPYAFTTTPQLGTGSATRSQPTNPNMSGSGLPQLPQLNLGGSSFGQRLSLGSLPTSFSAVSLPMSKTIDDISPPAPVHTAASNQANKTTPDRYRRNIRRSETADGATGRFPGSAALSGTGMAGVGQLYNHPGQSASSPSLNSYNSYRGTTHTAGTKTRAVASDDMQVGRQQTHDTASRYRRRSLGNIDTAGLNHHLGDPSDKASPHPNTIIQPHAGDYLSVQHVQRPTASHQHSNSSDRHPTQHKHTGSGESKSSSKSARSSRPGSSRNEPASGTSGTVPANAALKQDARTANTPSRFPEGGRRNPSNVSNPSPLSRPMAVTGEDDHRPRTSGPTLSTPAAEQLASLNQKGAKKSKSKLRRAFSFGSTAELRKATAQANMEKNSAANQYNKRSSRHEDELDSESAEVAAKQEAAGLGESIYSGQGNFFTGSTDNLSISSTASSASIMLRKMGKGMKKGGRSLVGLFRPKSVVGVPAADGPVNEASAAQVSLVTVEAEREKVNVNLDPHEHQGGGTGFPKLERNSLDNKLSTDSGSASTDPRSRQSIVGGERERAEVLAAVKKGILKRNDSNQSSPSTRPAPELSLPHLPNINDSPRSSAPSTPKDDLTHSGHRRTDSITINDHHDDYFASVTRFASLDSKSATPSTPSRNISFSPRIQFHDTWPSGEYDRRGDIATCNRLTPMLAQQIKEELNTFKMEMEVHESSKVYTHFF